MAKIVERIQQYCDYKKLSIRQLEKDIGSGNSTISKAISRGSDIQTNWLEIIVHTYTDLNPLWLLTGKGEMILETAGNSAANVAANGGGGALHDKRLNEVEEQVKELKMKLDAYIKGNGPNGGQQK